MTLRIIFKDGSLMDLNTDNIKDVFKLNSEFACLTCPHLGEPEYTCAECIHDREKEEK